MARRISRVPEMLRRALVRATWNWLPDRYDIAGYRRVYHLHVRKTGGTSLNHMFMSEGGLNGAQLYEQLAAAPGHRVAAGGRVFVGWNTRLIEAGNYFYGFSHTPAHRLKLPPRTLTLACFRDPVARVVSHYNMLVHYRARDVAHPALGVEGQWLGSDLREFLARIPPEHLLAQLYMFSSTFCVEEALERIQSLFYFLITDEFAHGVRELTELSGLRLTPVHVRKAEVKTSLDPHILAELHERLEPEYRLLEVLRRQAGERAAVRKQEPALRGSWS